MEALCPGKKWLCLQDGLSSPLGRMLICNGGEVLGSSCIDSVCQHWGRALQGCRQWPKTHFLGATRGLIAWKQCSSPAVQDSGFSLHISGMEWWISDLSYCCTQFAGHQGSDLIFFCTIQDCCFWAPFLQTQMWATARIKHCHDYSKSFLMALLSIDSEIKTNWTQGLRGVVACNDLEPA
jgi:hypothetical protein